MILTSFINPFTYIHSYIHLGNIKWVSTMNHFIFCLFYDSFQKLFIFLFFNVLLSPGWVHSNHIQTQTISSLESKCTIIWLRNYLLNTNSHFPFLVNFLERVFYTILFYFSLILLTLQLTEIWNLPIWKLLIPKVIDHHVDKLDRHFSGLILLDFQTIHGMLAFVWILYKYFILLVWWLGISCMTISYLHCHYFSSHFVPPLLPTLYILLCQRLLYLGTSLIILHVCVRSSNPL